MACLSRPKLQGGPQTADFESCGPLTNAVPAAMDAGRLSCALCAGCRLCLADPQASCRVCAPCLRCHPNAACLHGFSGES